MLITNDKRGVCFYDFRWPMAYCVSEGLQIQSGEDEREVRQLLHYENNHSWTDASSSPIGCQIARNLEIGVSTEKTISSYLSYFFYFKQFWSMLTKYPMNYLWFRFCFLISILLNINQCNVFVFCCSFISTEVLFLLCLFSITCVLLVFGMSALYRIYVLLYLYSCRLHCLLFCF